MTGPSFLPATIQAVTIQTLTCICSFICMFCFSYIRSFIFKSPLPRRVFTLPGLTLLSTSGKLVAQQPSHTLNCIFQPPDVTSYHTRPVSCSASLPHPEPNFFATRCPHLSEHFFVDCEDSDLHNF